MGSGSASGSDPEGPGSLGGRVRRLLVGGPRDIRDRSIFHRLSLVPFLAWVGLGADGLSSSSYGPEEAFRALGEHRYLSVALAVATAVTVFVIAAAYRRIIEQFPHGGGGYVVATKLLSPAAGVVSGSALLVDYVLTITVSIAAAGDATFSLLPPEAAAWKLPLEFASIGLLVAANIRGVRESILPLVPVFLVFLGTHAALLGLGAFEHVADIPATAAMVGEGFSGGAATIGIGGMLALFARAFSMGGGTYTGLEAVSNGMPVLREPRAHTGRVTMTYMAFSLAITAAGLLVCYLLVGIRPEEGKTLNAVLAEAVFGGGATGDALVIATLAAEGLLLVVGAQAGFLDGPRVLANMAHDGWVPRRFATLCERLTTQNGILLMGAASFAALAYTRGNVSALVVMYSINVFLTFSLSMLGMLGAAVRGRDGKQITLFAIALLLCVTILGVTVYEKFGEGGWITLSVTGLLAGSCFLTRKHYDGVARQLRKLDKVMHHLPEPATGHPPRVDHRLPTAAILVGGFNGLGVETVRHVVRDFGTSMKNLVFVCVGSIDSGTFKGEAEVEALRSSTEATIHKYEDLAHRLGHPAAGRYSVGTDPVEELDRLCRSVADTYPHVTFFAGQLAFSRERWYDRVLHNHTTLALQKRLLQAGLTVVILPRMVERGSRAQSRPRS